MASIWDCIRRRRGGMVMEEVGCLKLGVLRLPMLRGTRRGPCSRRWAMPYRVRESPGNSSESPCRRAQIRFTLSCWASSFRWDTRFPCRKRWLRWHLLLIRTRVLTLILFLWRTRPSIRLLLLASRYITRIRTIFLRQWQCRRLPGEESLTLLQ